MPVPMLKNVDRILYIQLVILFLSHNIFLARRIYDACIAFNIQTGLRENRRLTHSILS